MVPAHMEARAEIKADPVEELLVHSRHIAKALVGYLRSRCRKQRNSSS